MHAALRRLLTDTLTIEPFASQDGYGAPSYGAAISHKGRIDSSQQTIVTRAGQDIVSRAKVFLDADFMLSERDRVTFPDGRVLPIQRLDSPKDLQGNIDHYVIWF